MMSLTRTFSKGDGPSDTGLKVQESGSSGFEFWDLGFGLRVQGSGFGIG
jgi:hypothetical protein